MRALVFILATVLSLSVSTPVEENGNAAQVNDLTRNTVIEEAFLAILEELRNIILNGSDDFPVLDPLQINNLDLDLSIIGLRESWISASNAVLTNLGTFVVNSININLGLPIIGTSVIDLDIQIPVLDVGAENYKLDINISGLRVFGDGEADVSIINPRVTARINFRILLTRIELTSADVKLYLDEFKPSLTGVFNGIDGQEELNVFVNHFLEAFVPEAIVYFQEDISNVINPLVVQIGNEILGNINIGDLFPLQIREQLLTKHQS